MTNSVISELSSRGYPLSKSPRPSGMVLEIERKFLVAGDFSTTSLSASRIVQGYLNSTPERSVRVRIMGKQGFLTVKGIGNASGVSRFEWEREISLTDAEELLPLCEPGVIDKVRHIIPFGGHSFEVDVFAGENLGLIIAELELSSEEEIFERPDWLGPEITGEARYYNASLSRYPFTKWAVNH
jgi:adenylate cyclase